MVVTLTFLIGWSIGTTANDLITDSDHTLEILHGLHSLLLFHAETKENNDKQSLDGKLITLIYHQLLALASPPPYSHFTFCMNPIPVIALILLAHILVQGLKPRYSNPAVGLVKVPPFFFCNFLSFFPFTF